MSVALVVVLEQRLEEVIEDLPLQLGSCYTLRSRHGWAWLVKRGRHLFVDLLAAADYWEAARRPHVAVKLRARAGMLLEEIKQQQATAAGFREAVGQ